MFNATARTELEEALGYERYILKACNQAIRQSRGICSPVTIVIPDEGSNQICLHLEDTIGDTGARMTHRMSPLIFAAAYKLLDAVVEWTIRENGQTCPYRFARKVKILESTPSLVYPDFIGADSALRGVLLGLFKNALPYRNAITHNRWGKNDNGDLHFDFGRNGPTYTRVFKFDEVLAFAEAMALLGDSLVRPPVEVSKVNTMKWLLDQVVPLHGMPAFGITRPRYFRVVRQTRRLGAVPVVIDLTRVRSTVAQQAGLSSADYDLTVEAESATDVEGWEIRSVDLPPGDRLVLDAHWDPFRIAQ